MREDQTTEMRDQVLVDHVLYMTKEHGEIHYNIAQPEDCAGDVEVGGWAFGTWTVEELDGGRLALHGSTIGGYDVEVAEASRDNPASYLNRAVEVDIVVTADLQAKNGRGEYEVTFE